MADFDTPDVLDAIDDPELKKTHQTALTRFHLSASYFAPQRQREVDNLKFVDFEEQWDPTTRTQRAGNQAVGGLPPTPARPTLTINQLRGPCQQVASQRRSARLALSFAPKGNGATQDIADVFDDIVRGIQQDSRASIARNWASDRAEKAGLGWYRIDTQYAIEHPTDPNDPAWNDQEIVYRRVLNQASVYPDPFAQEPDFSDGRFLYVTEDMPWEVYKREYPNSRLASFTDGELTGVGDKAQDFVFTADVGGEQGQTIRIAEYWEVVETRRRRVQLEDGRTAFEDELPQGTRAKDGGAARWVTERKIVWSKINAIEFLDEPQDWNGSYIPLVPVIGEEFNVNGERRWGGLVTTSSKDAAVSYNVMRSAQVETIGLATKAPYIGYFETIEPYLEWWKQSNVRNFFMLPIKAVRDAAGNFLPPPQRNVEEPAIQAITLAAHEAKTDVHTTTGVPPVALGQLDPHDRSGKAIQALQAQAETGSSGYLDNLVNISMAYEGKVLRDLIPRIYDRPKRIVPAVGVDENRRMVMLNWPFAPDPKTKQPIPLPQWTPGQPIPDGATHVDLAAGEYGIAATVGKSYATRREEASAAIGNVLQVVPPEMAAAIAPAWLEEQDYPGAKKIAEIAKKALPPQLAAAYNEEEDTQIPPEVQAMLQQLQQENAQLKQMVELDAAKEQAKQQGAIAKAQMDGQVKLQQTQVDAQAQAAQAARDEQAESLRNQRDNEVKLEIARIQAQKDLAIAQIQAASEDQNRRIQILEQMIGLSAEQARVEEEHTHDAIERQRDRELTAEQSQAERDNKRQLQAEKPQPSAGA